MVIVDQVLFRFSVCRSVPEIFAISYQKSRRILDVFCPSKFQGAGFQKRYHPCLTARRLEKFREDTPTSSEVIGFNTLNFRSNFKFSRFFFWGGGRSGTPSPLGCVLASLGQSLACIKFEGAAHPNGRSIVSQKSI